MTTTASVRSKPSPVSRAMMRPGLCSWMTWYRSRSGAAKCWTRTSWTVSARRRRSSSDRPSMTSMRTSGMGAPWFGLQPLPTGRSRDCSRESVAWARVPVAPPVWAGCGAGWSGVPGDAGGGNGGGEVAVVDLGVVSRAEQGAVGQVGGSAVAPVHDVVGVAPGGGDGAAGEAAAVVAGGQGQALGAGEQAPAAAEVEGFAVAAEDQGDDLGVAGEGGPAAPAAAPAAVPAAVPAVAVALAVASHVVEEGVVVDEDDDLGLV